MVSLGMWIASMLPVSEQSMGAPPGSFINKYTLRKARRARGVTGRQPPLPQRQGGHQNVARRPLALCQGSPTTHTYIPTLYQPQDTGFNAPPRTPGGNLDPPVREPLIAMFQCAPILLSAEMLMLLIPFPRPMFQCASDALIRGNPIFIRHRPNCL